MGDRWDRGLNGRDIERYSKTIQAQQAKNELTISDFLPLFQ